MGIISSCDVRGFQKKLLPLFRFFFIFFPVIGLLYLKNGDVLIQEIH